MTKVTFKISYIRVRRGEVLGVTGSCPELGEWNKPVLLDDKDFPVWKGSVTIKGNAEYKFVIADKATGMMACGEDLGMIPACVCTSSTHDMAPVRAWWEEEDKDSIQRFYNQRLGRQGIAPEGCGPDICEQIVAQHLYSPAMLTILPLQDWVGMDGDIRYGLPAEERINVPAIPRYYWRYRMHLTLEELLGKADFNSKVLELVTDCGR